MNILSNLQNLISRKLAPILLLFSLCSFGLSTEVKHLSNSSITDMSLTEYAPEKIYVHFDKSDYVAEENIWFKVYLLNTATTTLGTNSKVVYLDLIDANNKILDTKIVKTVAGFGEGNIPLPFDAIEGEYTIRAYTNYMRNFDDSFFFKESVFVRSKYSKTVLSSPTTNEKINVSDLNVRFFPEGGQLVSGYNNKIGFKVVGPNNKGIDIEGEIVDETGKKVIGFATSKFGMGLFHLIPKDGKGYTANIFHNNTTFSYNIPKSMNTGVALRIIEGKEFYQANIQSSLTQGINQYKFTAKQRNGKIFSSEIVGNSANAVIKIPKDIFREGVINFELSNQNSEKVVSRLSFYEVLAEEKPKVTVAVVEKDSKQKVVLNLDSGVNTNLEADMTTNVSVSIAKVPANSTIKEEQGIKTYLLLTSEVTGTIEQPNYYINSSEKERKKNLDVLMLTEKWKEYSTAMKTKNQSALEFNYETGITLSGTIKSAYNRGIPAIAKVSLSYKNKETIGFDETISDSNGKFVFQNLDFSDTTSIMLQALSSSSNKKSKKGSSDFHIEIDAFSPPKISKTKKYNPSPSADNSTKTKRFNLVNDSFQQVDDDVIQLDAVEVRTKGIKKEETYYTDRRLLYKEPSQTLDFDEFREMGFRNALEALRGRVPGLSIRGNIQGNFVYLRGSSSLGSEGDAIGTGSALVLVDGMPVGSDILEQMLPSEIDFIDILKGPRAAIYGSRASNGAIAVYTKTRTKKNNLSNVIKNSNIEFNHTGFVKPQEFHLAANSKTKYLSSTSSTTFLWKPTLLFRNTAESEILFDSQKESGRYRITVQGISSDGIPIYTDEFFNMK